MLLPPLQSYTHMWKGQFQETGEGLGGAGSGWQPRGEFGGDLGALTHPQGGMTVLYLVQRTNSGAPPDCKGGWRCHPRPICRLTE